MNPQTEIDILKLEKAVAELDANWFRRQDSFKVHSRGRDYIPQTDDTNVGYGLLILAFICMMAFYSVSLIPTVKVLFGVVIVFFWGFFIYQDNQKAQHYQNQKALYERQKAELLAQIEKLKGAI